MSRHLLIDRPDCQVVLGFDHPLQAFFGQIFNPSDKRREGTPVGGWPTRSGLGMRPPVTDHSAVARDLEQLRRWARARQPDQVWAHPEAEQHLDALLRALRGEWDDGDDAPERPVPACLQGAMP